MGSSRLTGLILGIVLFCSGCNEEGTAPAKNAVRATNLYLEYQVWGDEERGEVTVLLQLRQKSNRGGTVKLGAPGFVALDGEVLSADSSRMGGVFYEARRPLEDFAGSHKLTVTDESGAEVSESFVFTPFTLATPLRERVRRKDLVLTLAGLEKEDKLRVTLVDTVFSTEDINEVVPVVNGRLHITPQQLKGVATGPVTLLLFKEEEGPVSNPGIRGGTMAVTYGLMRAFELVD